MIQCPQCRTLNQPKSRFCSGCGAQFSGPPLSTKGKNDLRTPIAILLGVLLMCALCGMCGRSNSNTNVNTSAGQANFSTTVPAALVSTTPPNRAVNTGISPPRNKSKQKKPLAANSNKADVSGDDWSAAAPQYVTPRRLSLQSQITVIIPDRAAAVTRIRQAAKSDM